MGNWNTVNISYVIGKNRIDADFYKKSDVKLEIFLAGITSNEKLRKYAGEISEKFQKSECDVFQYNDIGNTDMSTGLIKENLVKVDKAPGRATYINRYNDILISTVRPNRNANAIVNQNDFLQIGSNGFCNIRSKNIDPNYIFIYSKTKYFIDTLIRATTSSMYPSVSNKDILNVPFFKPNDLEVEKISSVVAEARRLLINSKSLYLQATNLLERELNIDNSDLDKLSNKYISNFNSVIDGKRLDPEYYNPKTKAIVERIKELHHTTVYKNFEVKNGFPWNSKYFLEDNFGLPVIRIRDIKPTYIDKEKLTSIELNYANSIEFKSAKKGDIVVGMDGLKYFYASILEDDCMVNQRVCHLIRKVNSKVSSEYATFIINSKIGQSQIMRDMTIATTVGHITNSNIRKIIIPIFSETFQNNITKLVRQSIDEEVKAKKILNESKTRVEQLMEEAAKK